MANETARPGGFHAPSLDERWRMRLVVSSAERENFHAALEPGCGRMRIPTGSRTAPAVTRSCGTYGDHPCARRARLSQTQEAANYSTYFKPICFRNYVESTTPSVAYTYDAQPTGNPITVPMPIGATTHRRSSPQQLPVGKLRRLSPTLGGEIVCMKTSEKIASSTNERLSPACLHVKNLYQPPCVGSLHVGCQRPGGYRTKGGQLIPHVVLHQCRRGVNLGSWAFKEIKEIGFDCVAIWNVVPADGGSWDLTEIVRNAPMTKRAIQAANAAGLKVFLGIWNPSNMGVVEQRHRPLSNSGEAPNRPNIYSQTWQNEVWIPYLEGIKREFGSCPGYAGIVFDDATACSDDARVVYSYTPEDEKNFSGFLEKTYGSIASFNLQYRRYKNAYKTFAEAKPPKSPLDSAKLWKDWMCARGEWSRSLPNLPARPSARRRR